MRNLKKNQGNDLLPQRRPRLGKFILLAVVVHVVLAVFFIQFYTKKTEKELGLKVKPEKVISKPEAKKVRHATSMESFAYLLTESRPMSPSIMMAIEDGNTSVPFLLKKAWKPIPLHMPVLEPKKSTKLEVLGTKTAIAWNQKNNTERLLPKRKMPVNATLAEPRQVKASLPPKIVGARPKTPVLETFSAQVRVRKLGKTDKQLKEWLIKRADHADIQLAPISEKRPVFSIIPSKAFQVNAPNIHFKAGALEMVVNTKFLARQTFSWAVRTGTLEKSVYLNSKIVSQEEARYTISALEPSAWFSKTRIQPKIPPTPNPLAGNIAKLVNRLIQPALGKYAEQKARVLVKNLTYRDKGLESEGSKFLSGVVRVEIEKLDRVDLLAPTDISKTPHIELEGEIWDDSKTVSIYLRIEEGKTNHKLNNAALKIGKELLPEKLVLKPPEGESLDIVQSVVELMKQLFPRPGDFQIGVWPDKGLDAVYIEGETFMASILTETDAYLQVDYYQVDGKVVHILPNPLQSNFIEGGRPFVIGNAESPYEFIVAAPFGEELLVVIASQEPIGTEARNIIEPAKPYLRQLARSLREQKAKRGMAGAHYIILTRMREPEHSKP